MTSSLDIEAAAELLRVLGHSVRLALINSLAAGERSVGDIEAQTGIGQPALSQQLALLRKAGLVTTRREAKMVFYSIDSKRITEVKTLFDAFDGRVAALRASPKPSFSEGGTVATFARVDRVI